MNLHTPYPYWLLKSGFLCEYPALRHPLSVDFLVMGGGITGALTSWYLAQAGVSVAVVDRRHIGMGSTCASTALLQYALTHALLQDAMKHGAQVFDKTEIVDIQHEKTQVALKTNHGHAIRAKHLVIAGGYESQAYLEQKVTRMHSTYVLVSEPFESEIWYRDALIWETARPYLYLRTTPDRRVLVGGRDEPFYSPGKRDKLLNTKTRLLAQDFNKRFPTLAPLFVDFNWAGTFAETADGLPFIGSVKDQPRTIFALGFGGNGIVFSQIAGEIIRDFALGKKHPDAHIFSFDRANHSCKKN